MKTSANVAVRVSAAVSGATLSGNKWTPAKDAAGLVEQREWDGLPRNTFVEWMDTSLESQLQPPYGAEAGYQDPGVSRIADHYDGFTGMGFDEATGRCYHFGGGHAGSANNMLSCFDAAKGTHSIIIPPTHQSRFPTAPGVGGYAGGRNFSFAYYDTGLATDPSGGWNYFPSIETPAGDDKPCASHEYSGIVFVPGINEVLLPRFGWFHALLDQKKWRVGPQVAVADRRGFLLRGGIGFNCHYLPSTGLVYMTGEGSQLSENAAYFTIVKYNPVTRKEVGTINWDAGATGTSCVDQNSHLWYFQGSAGDVFRVSTVDLLGTSIRGRTATTGRVPSGAPSLDSPHPVQYVPDIDKMLTWCTYSRSGGAQKGEMLEFNRSTLAFKLFPIAGAPPTAPDSMGNKMRYWPAKKVMLFQLKTSLNCWVLRLA